MIRPFIPFVDGREPYARGCRYPYCMRHVVAVDLGATTTRAAIAGMRGNLRRKREARTPAGETDPSVLIGFVEDLIREVAEGPRPVTAIGLSVAGPVDTASGILLNPPNIVFRNVPLAGSLSRLFGCPVRMINDCHAGVLAEMEHGLGRGRNDVVYLTVSTGIGAGVVSGKRLLLGRNGNAGEAGHFHVDDCYRLPCGCGAAGHWEGYASGRHLPRFFAEWCRFHRRSGMVPSDAEGIFALARQGDRDALCFARELSRINARGISDLIVAYDPELIILDGTVIRENADLLLPWIRDSIDRFLPLPEIAISSLSGEAPLIGAGIIAGGYRTSFGSLQ